MLLENFSLSGIGFGSWDETFLWLVKPCPNLLIITCVIILLFFSATRLRGFWGIVVCLVSGAVIIICLKNIVRLW